MLTGLPQNSGESISDITSLFTSDVKESLQLSFHC